MDGLGDKSAGLGKFVQAVDRFRRNICIVERRNAARSGLVPVMRYS